MNPKNHNIGVDLLGGENPPDVYLAAITEWKHQLPKEVHLLLLANEQLCKTHEHLQDSSFSFYPVKETIFLHEHPLSAIRKKKNSSICQGLRLLKEKKIDAFVSSGNTGALVAAAKIMLPWAHVKRPALAVLLPTRKNLAVLIDAGASVSASALDLKEFALLAAGLQKFRGIERPSIGLLNIGSEMIKGTKAIQEAYVLLQSLASQKNFSFTGNIEAKEFFEGEVDVLVTDGFAGNVLLKTAEGFSSFVLDLLKKESGFAALEGRLSYAHYGGALLLGINGVVIKCHSYSSPKAFISAIEMAMKWGKDLPSFLKEYLHDS